MTLEKRYLNPSRKLIDETVDRMKEHIRVLPSGAKSLAHLLVVVPTAQAGRNLRRALAKKYSAIVPPRVMMPSFLLIPSNPSKPVASSALELASLATILSSIDHATYPHLFPSYNGSHGVTASLDIAASLLPLWQTLGERALLLRDVKVDDSEEAKRWDELALLENEFLSAVHARGFITSAEARREAIAAAELPPGIELVILPALVDAQPALCDFLSRVNAEVELWIHADESDAEMFDEWGRPVGTFTAPIDTSTIFPAPTPKEEADLIARWYRSIPVDRALPALALCDDSIFPEIEGAFRNVFAEEELTVWNPSRELVVHSSLGRLLSAMLELGNDARYEVFSAFFRSWDVQRWLAREQNLNRGEAVALLAELDELQNEHLPENMDAVWRWGSEQMKNAIAKIKGFLPDPLAFLRSIFDGRILGEENPGDREFAAAVESVRALHDEIKSLSLEQKWRLPLFKKLLATATYDLEPTAPNVLRTDGWLELQWSPADEVALAGFVEGAVPESVVGHPFLPDSLRRDLGLLSNERRTARDSYILSEIVRSRRPGTVDFFLHQLAADGSVMKPSRLIFDGVSDSELPILAKSLYVVTKGNESSPVRTIPSAWKLKLPIPPEMSELLRFSASKLEAYVKCPFSFYLSQCLGEEVDDRALELDSLAFGNLCHHALDKFGKDAAVKDSTDAKAIGDYLEARVWEELAEYGKDLPAIIELQGSAAVARLRNFAKVQAERRAAGWRILYTERRLKTRFAPLETEFSGSIDRIDRNDVTGEIQIIDYKTGDKAESKNYANSFQLPIYRAMVQTNGVVEPEQALKCKALYCILGRDAENTRFMDELVFDDANQAEKENEIREILGKVKRGIFWPMNRKNERQLADNFGSVLGPEPLAGIDPAWIADQERRVR